MRPRARGILTAYAASWGYLAVLATVQVCFAVMPSHDRAAIVRWASTSVHNLAHDPLGCLVVSAFVTGGVSPAALLWAGVALLSANRVLGNAGTALVGAAGQVAGTLVSEGIVAYRVAHGALPPADRYLIDVGPSYVVVAVAVAAVAYGGWLARIAAALDLALLVFIGGIFDGLTRLHVAAVGHTTAMTTAALLGGWWVWRSRRRAAAMPREAETEAAETEAAS